jgi:hypothetical protein
MKARDFNFQNSTVELVAVAIMSALLGAVASSLFSWDANSPEERATLLSGFGGALLGAAISAFASMILSRQQAKEVLLRDAQASEREDQSCMLSLMIKTSLILSDVVAIRRSIDESLVEANDRNLTHLPLWMRILPIVGKYRTYDVEARELAPLIAMREYDIVYDANNVVMQHASLVEGVKEYSRLRQEVKALTSKHAADPSGILVSEFTEEEMGRLAPYTLELESLIRTIRARLPELQCVAERVTYGIGPAVRRRYPDADFPMFVPKTTDDEGSDQSSAS